MSTYFVLFAVQYTLLLQRNEEIKTGSGNRGKEERKRDKKVIHPVERKTYRKLQRDSVWIAAARIIYCLVKCVVVGRLATS